MNRDHFEEYYESYHKILSNQLETSTLDDLEKNKDKLCTLFITTYDNYYTAFNKFYYGKKQYPKRDHKILKIITTDEYKNENEKSVIDYVNKLFVNNITNNDGYTVVIKKIYGRVYINSEEYYWMFHKSNPKKRNYKIEKTE